MKQRFLPLFSKGIAMGMAEVVPGVSGGTIAFITGIYENLITSIRRIDASLLKKLKDKQWSEAWEYVNADFLVKLLLGMVTGIVVGIFGISFLIDTYPIQVWAFFFSLIAASSFLVARDIKRFTWKSLIFIAVGTAIALWITTGNPRSGDHSSLIFIFISGVLAISALLLPGLSGSFVLLLLGMYTVVIPAVKEVLSGNFSEFNIVAFFALGCIVGLFTLSRLLHWGYLRYRDPVLGILTGFMLGSLNKIWPWQKVLETIEKNGREVVTKSLSVSPKTFSSLEANAVFGTDPFMTSSVVIMCITFIVIISISFVSKKM
jgi:putative membrane protein